MHPLEMIWCKHLQRKEMQYLLQICIHFFKARHSDEGKIKTHCKGAEGYEHNSLIVAQWGRLQSRALSRKDECLSGEMVRSKRGLTLSSSHLWTKLIVCTFGGENTLTGILLSSSKMRGVPCALVCCLSACFPSWLRSFGRIAPMQVSTINSVHHGAGGELMKWAE